MTGVTSLLAAKNNTNAAFRAWGLGVSTALDTLGFPKTSDTGQIDWTTVLAPTAASQTQGYEVRRFSDSLQSTNPVFFKLSFGSMSGTVSFSQEGTPQITIVVGTATDGTGTITSHASWPGTTYAMGTLFSISSSSDYFSGPNGQGASVASNCYFDNGDGSGLAMLMWPSQGNFTNGGGFLLLERSRNPDGTPNGDSVMVLNAYSSQSSAQVNTKLIVYGPSPSYLQPAVFVGAPVFYFPTATANPGLVKGLTVYPQPVFTGFSPRLGGPSQLVVAVNTTDFASLTPFTMNHYGVARSWLPAGLGSTTLLRWGQWAQLLGLSAGATTLINSFAMRID